jgi:hypothetical protein
VQLQFSEVLITSGGTITLSNPEVVQENFATFTRYEVSSNSIKISLTEPYALGYNLTPAFANQLSNIREVLVFHEGAELSNVDVFCVYTLLTGGQPLCNTTITPPKIVLMVEHPLVPGAVFGVTITPPEGDILDFDLALCGNLVVANDKGGSPAITMRARCPESRVPRLLDSCKAASYHIGGKKFVRTMYSKNLNSLAMDQSQYMFSGLMAKNNLPTPPCKSPFPITTKANKWCGISYTDPIKAAQAGILPPDWGACRKCIHSGTAIKLPTVSQGIGVQTKLRSYGPYQLKNLWGQRIEDPISKVTFAPDYETPPEIMMVMKGTGITTRVKLYDPWNLFGIYPIQLSDRRSIMLSDQFDKEKNYMVLKVEHVGPGPSYGSGFYIGNGQGNAYDLSKYKDGTVNFDIKVLNPSTGGSKTFFVKIDCIFPCQSKEIQFEPSQLNTWETFNIPLSELINEGGSPSLDITKVSTGIVIFAKPNNQDGIIYLLDNVFWRV